MNPLVVSALGSIIRAVLLEAAGYFVKQGIWSASAADAYMSALALTIVGLGWGLFEKYKSRLKFLTALEAPVGTTEAMVDDRVKVGIGATVPMTLAK